jgi:hypothetical protein
MNPPFDVDFQPVSVNGEAVYRITVTDENGVRVWQDTRDFGPAFNRARAIDELIRRKFTAKSADQLELEILAKIQADEVVIQNGGGLPPLYTARQLIDEHPTLHPPVIDGLLRQGEVMNIISVSKIGKSWLLYTILLSIVSGESWLGRFATTRGRVLLIDNELHKPTIGHRLRKVAEALGIPVEDWIDSIDIWPLRGALQDIYGIGRRLESCKGRYSFIAIDAKYRAIPANTSENDNAAETAYYNEIDRICQTIECASGMVHHSSKGSQSDKRVTDVGAGAGAQSRAADTHLVLREHEEGDAVVLEAAVRSFAPVEPIGLRWQFPLWVPDDRLDTQQLKGKRTQGEEKQSKRDEETDEAVLKCCKAWRTKGEIQEETGFGKQRVNRGVARLRAAERLEEGKEDRPRNPGSTVFRTKTT